MCDVPSAKHVSAHVRHHSLLSVCQHICDFPMLLQARAMHGQAPLQRSDLSSQPVCKVSASTSLLLVPVLKVHTWPPHLICIQSVAMQSASPGHMPVFTKHTKHDKQPSCLISLHNRFCQMTPSLSCRVSLQRALSIFCWMHPARPWGCAPACPTTPPSWTSCRSSLYVTSWHECLKLFLQKPSANVS